MINNSNSDYDKNEIDNALEASFELALEIEQINAWFLPELKKCHDLEARGLATY